MSWRNVAEWLGLPAGRGTSRPAGRPARVARKPAPAWLRNLGVTSLASVAVWPARWSAGSVGMIAVSMVTAPGAWRLALIAAAPFAWRRTLMILTRSDQRSLGILPAVSSRVESLDLARRLRRIWHPEMHRYGLIVGTRQPTLTRVNIDPFGVDAIVNLQPVGATVAEFARHAGHLQSAMGGPPRLSITGRSIPATARLRIQHHDPLAQPLPAAELPASTQWNRVVTGLTEDAAPVHRDLLLPQLTVGAQGAGKSSEAWTFIRAVQAAGIPYRLRVFDPKGQEFASLRDAAYVYESNPGKWGEFVSTLLGGLSKRQRELARDGVTELTKFTRRNPLDITIVDELLVAVTMARGEVNVGGTSIKIDDAVKLFLSQARAAGYTMLALSQMGQADVVGRIRPLFGYATCLRVGALESALVDVMLGGKDAHQLYPAHEIPPGRRCAGIGYTRDEIGRVVRYRAGFCDAAARAAIVDQLRRDTDRFAGGPRKEGRKRRAAA